MQLTMTIVLRNGQEFLEDNVLYHHNKGVDSFVIYLHKCSDGSLEIATALSRKVPVYFRELKDDVFQGAKIRHEMAMLAKQKFGATWVINNDIDEVWTTEDSLKKEFEALDSETNVLYAPRFNVLPYIKNGQLQNMEALRPMRQFSAVVTKPTKLDKSKNFDQITATDYLLRSVNSKAACKTEGLNGIEIGSHEIYINNKVQLMSKKISILHYFIRSPQLFVSKVLNNTTDMLNDAARLEKQGWHLRFFKHLIETNTLNTFAKNLELTDSQINDLEKRNIIEINRKVIEALENYESN